MKCLSICWEEVEPFSNKKLLTIVVDFCVAGFISLEFF